MSESSSEPPNQNPSSNVPSEDNLPIEAFLPNKAVSLTEGDAESGNSSPVEGNPYTWEPPILAEPSTPLGTIVHEYRPPPWKAISLLGVLLLATILGMFLDGELGRFLQASWEVGIFALLGTLAYAGLNQPVAKVFSWLLLIGMLALATVANLFFTGMAFSSDDPDSSMKVLLGVFLGSCIASSSMFLVWAPWMRGLFSKLTGQTEWTSVRLLALGAVLSLTLVSVIPLLFLGEPPILMMLNNGIDLMAGGASSGDGTIDVDAQNAESLRGDMYALSWTMLGAALAVGYGVNRNWRETLERLGLLSVSFKQLGLAIAMIGLLFGLSFVVDEGIAKVWGYFGWPITDDSAVSKLFSAYLTPTGAIVIAICAGLGEEVAVRGILQPRLGILLSNLFFTSMHAYQYGWDALLSVFFVGIALGMIRSKTNTTVSAIVHGGYDFTLVLVELYSLETAQ